MAVNVSRCVSALSTMWIQRVLVCPERMLWMRMTGDGTMG